MQNEIVGTAPRWFADTSFFGGGLEAALPCVGGVWWRCSPEPVGVVASMFEVLGYAVLVGGFVALVAAISFAFSD